MVMREADRRTLVGWAIGSERRRAFYAGRNVVSHLRPGAAGMGHFAAALVISILDGVGGHACITAMVIARAHATSFSGYTNTSAAS
jgi:hypothetical protein